MFAKEIDGICIIVFLIARPVNSDTFFFLFSKSGTAKFSFNSVLVWKLCEILQIHWFRLSKYNLCFQSRCCHERNYAPRVPPPLLVCKFLKSSSDHVILPVHPKSSTWLPEEFVGSGELNSLVRVCVRHCTILKSITTANSRLFRLWVAQ